MDLRKTLQHGILKVYKIGIYVEHYGMCTQRQLRKSRRSDHRLARSCSPIMQFINTCLPPHCPRHINDQTCIRTQIYDQQQTALPTQPISEEIRKGERNIFLFTQAAFLPVQATASWMDLLDMYHAKPVVQNVHKNVQQMGRESQPILVS